MPKISVIMPVYNSGKYLSTAVNSILSQSFSDFELIMVDDGSTDGSSERCDEYAKADSRVVVIHQKNGGICQARNSGLKIARGEYIGFSDHDDEFLPGAFEKMINFAEANDLDWAKCGHYTEMEKDGKAMRSIELQHHRKETYSKEELGYHYLQLLSEGQMNDLWDSLYKGDFLRTNKLYLDPYFKAGGEDIHFNGRVVACKPKFGVIPDLLYIHYVHVGFSTSSKFHESNIEMHLNYPKRLNSYLEPYGAYSIYEQQIMLYARIITESTISAVCTSLTHPKCDYDKAKKNSILNKIRYSDQIYEGLWNISKWKFFSSNPKYGILFSLFELRLYKLCLLVHKVNRNFKRYRWGI